ncbi:MAG: Tim44/TimA family putative adaptor protein [Pseudomonadota bacterium]
MSAPVLRPVPAGEAANDQAPTDIEPAARREPLPEWAEVIAEDYPGFEPKEFLQGAASAYEMIVEAYAIGDVQSIKGFVAKDVLESFQAGIEQRTASGHQMALTFVGVETPDVVRSERDGDNFEVELSFRSEQVRATKDAEGNVLDGSEETVITVVDRWVFERPVRSRDPNWTLVATQGSND